MAGLDCGTVSTTAWPILRSGVSVEGRENGQQRTTDHPWVRRRHRLSQKALVVGAVGAVVVVRWQEASIITQRDARALSLLDPHHHQHMANLWPQSVKICRRIAAGRRTIRPQPLHLPFTLRA